MSYVTGNFSWGSSQREAVCVPDAGYILMWTGGESWKERRCSKSKED